MAGVAGIDVPIFKINELTPQYKLGPLGYSFGVNPNGFLVFHPGLWLDASYFDDPIHVDFADIEGETDELKRLRDSLIEATTSVAQMRVEEALEMEARVPLDIKKKYFYVKIDEPDFT